MEGVYLVSYADGPEIFYKNQNALVFSALNKGIDFFFNYRREHIDPEFIKKNEYIFNQKKGAGYWLWKPWVILKTLNTVPENAIVIYADTGFVFYESPQPLLELARTNGIILVNYEDTKAHGKAGEITKRETLIRMGCDADTCRYGNHLWAAFVIVRNTPVSRAFIKKWLDYCSDEISLTDTPSTVPEYPENRGHTHDESILSILYNKEPEGKHLITTEELRKYVRWHRRHPGDEYYSLLLDIGKKLKGIERDFINSSWMKWFREKTLERSPKKPSITLG